jgi:L-threonylcarbamoyladenylate synthase
MKIIPLNESAVHESSEVLKSGGLVIFPSDTVYGALADSTCESAVTKLLTLKNRPAGKPISVFVSDMTMLGGHVEVGDRDLLLRKLLPGPFTVILGSRHKTDARLESERGTLGVRIPDYDPILRLVKEFEKPMTATSANLSGRPPHYSVESLLREFPQSKIKLIDLIVDGGKLPRNKPSTVVDLTTPEIKIMRRGDGDLHKHQAFTTHTAHETEKTAQLIVEKYLGKKSEAPLIFILEGDMGVGKTVFVKGAGRLFAVEDVTSPTYVISCEYKVKKWGIEKFIHCDLCNIAEQNEFAHLGLEEYVKPGNILFIEWGERAGELYDLFKNKGKVVHVAMRYINEKVREIAISS